MTKRIVVLNTDGTERMLAAAPDLKEMQTIVGGYIEHVRVLDRIESGQFIFTSMFVNEEGLLQNLPRNPKATEWYQRNVRAQFPDADNPFREAVEAWHRKFSGAVVHTDLTPPSAVAAGYQSDPWIAGPAILFEGYTVDEVDALMSGEEES